MRIDPHSPERHAYVVLIDGRKVERLDWADTASNLYCVAGKTLQALSVKVIKRPDAHLLNPLIDLTPEVWETEISKDPGRYAVEWAEPHPGLDDDGKPITVGYTVRMPITDALAAARLYHAERDCSDISAYDMLVDLLVIHWGCVISLYVPFDPSTLTSHEN